MYGVYVHIPFCVQKCSYCDFPSYGGQSRARQSRYLAALAAEIAYYKKDGRWQTPTSIFIGGGTPSLLDEPLLASLLEMLRTFVSPQLQEYTIEANPESLTAGKLALLHDHGVNRLSIGVQSPRAEMLGVLGRSHSWADFQRVLAEARAAGFTNISADFMYGLPGQSLADWLEDLALISQLGLAHLSLYQLHIEEGTGLARGLREGQIAEFDDDVASHMYQANRDILARAGYRQYEISNYAQPGYESRHNSIYWQTQSYLGLGLGAASFAPPERRTNPHTYQGYVTPLLASTLPVQERTVLTKEEMMSETMFMGLRLNDGVDLKDFAKRYGQLATTFYADAIDTGVKRGWLTTHGDRLRLTDAGRLVGNWVFALFL